MRRVFNKSEKSSKSLNAAFNILNKKIKIVKLNVNNELKGGDISLIACLIARTYA